MFKKKTLLVTTLLASPAVIFYRYLVRSKINYSDFYTTSYNENIKATDNHNSILDNSLNFDHILLKSSKSEPNMQRKNMMLKSSSYIFVDGTKLNSYRLYDKGGTMFNKKAMLMTTLLAPSAIILYRYLSQPKINSPDLYITTAENEKVKAVDNNKVTNDMTLTSLYSKISSNKQGYFKNMFNMEGKNVVITGASYGVGRAAAIGFSRLGANVAILARSKDKLEETQKLMDKHGSIILLTTDLCDNSQIEKAANQIKENFSSIDILVNNAAGWYTGTLEEMDSKSIEKMISSTVTGSILITKYVLSHLKNSENPHIVNVISTAALPAKDIDPANASVAFYAAKWGQAGFSEAVRAELRPYKIKVTTLYPGSIATESSIDDSEQEILKKRPGALGVSDIFEAILFSVTRSASSSVNSMTLTHP